MRESSEFKATTGADLLRDGADEFKKMLADVDGGVLFIDEVRPLRRMPAALAMRQSALTHAPPPVDRCTSSTRRTTRMAPTS